MSEFYDLAKADGTRFGQMEKKKLLAKVARGDLPTDTLIRGEDKLAWKPVSSLYEDADNTRPWGLFSALRDVYRTRCFDFNGRAGREELWYSTISWFVLNNLLAWAGMRVYDWVHPLGTGVEMAVVLFLLSPLLVLEIYAIVPLTAVLVRRLHDLGLRGWYMFVLCIPIPLITFLFFAACFFLPSDKPNRWGMCPAGPAK